VLGSVSVRFDYQIIRSFDTHDLHLAFALSREAANLEIAEYKMFSATESAEQRQPKFPATYSFRTDFAVRHTPGHSGHGRFCILFCDGDSFISVLLT
jgi:hypothetical protein